MKEKPNFLVIIIMICQSLLNRLQLKGNMASVCPVLFLFLAVGWAAMLVMSEIDVQPNETQYEKFIRQHYAENMTVDNCTSTIKERSINLKEKKCKKTNTFIVNVNESQITDVCGNAGYKDHNQRKSKKRFQLINCTLIEPTTYPTCNYTGQKADKCIMIECKNDQPVHFVRGEKCKNIISG
ncbi:ribonuclease-like [Paramormyrops kingsleyae]|uniref:ribonuclease-like n=1 Tax=Paramormyrops kingsleyae TaxID=1676925 RepID=UPI003B972597